MRKPKSIAAIFNDAKASSGHFRALKENVRSRLTIFRQDREKENQQVLEADFNNVLEKWGIMSTENIGEVIFCLRLRLFILASLPVFYGVFALVIRSFNSLMVFLLLALPCLFGCLTTAWRIWILKHTHFSSFTRWLTSGCGLWL